MSDKNFDKKNKAYGNNINSSINIEPEKIVTLYAVIYLRVIGEARNKLNKILEQMVKFRKIIRREPMLDDLLNYKFHDMGIGLDYKIILPDYIFNNKVIININTIDGINKKVIINNLFSLSTLEKPNKYYLDSGEEEGDRSREIIIKYDKHKEEPIEFIQ